METLYDQKPQPGPVEHSDQLMPVYLVWDDRARRLGFTWTGHASVGVVVTDHSPAGPVIDTFLVSVEAQEAFVAAAGSPSGMTAVFQAECQLYDGRSAASLLDKLGAVVAKARQSGDDDDLEAVFLAAEDLVNAKAAQ